MFDWFISDIAGFAFGVAFFPLVVLLPGVALFRHALPDDWREASFERRLGLGLIFGFCVWPLILATVGKVGTWAMLVAATPAGFYGAFVLFKDGARLQLSFAVKTAAAVFALSAVLTLIRSLPWPTDEGFLVHETMWDGQKHAAVTRMIIETGIPPKNLFWTLEGSDGNPPLGYYYQFYTLPAVISLASFDMAQAHHALFSCQAWLILAFHVLILEILRCIAGRSPEPKMRHIASGSLLFIGSLLPILKFEGLLLPVEDHFVLFFSGVSWVPQHFAAAVSAVFGLMLLARAGTSIHVAPPMNRWRLGATAAAALSNALASSIPVGAVAAAAGTVWLLLALGRRDMRSARFSLAVGLSAIVMALPVILTMLATHGRVHEDKGIVFGIRNPSPFEALEHPIFAVINTPAFFAVHLGILLLGTVVCLRMFRARLTTSPVTVLLGIMTVISLLFSIFVKSNIMFNDFGWRAINPGLFVFAALTVIAIENVARTAGFLRTAFAGAYVLCAVDAAFLLTLRFLPHEENVPSRNIGVRILWDEIDKRLPPDAIVQLQPYDRPLRAAFLYRKRWAAMPDEHHAVVYGLSLEESEQRRRALHPLYWNTHLTSEEALHIARRFRIDFVVVENMESVWSAPEAWPQTMRPYLETPQFRVYDMREVASPAP